MLVFPAIALAAIAALPLGTTAIGVSGGASIVDAVSHNLTSTIPGASRPLRAPLQGVSTLLNYFNPVTTIGDGDEDEDNHWGDSIREDPKDLHRIYFQNVDGLRNDCDKKALSVSTMAQLKVGTFCWADPCLDFSQMSVRRSLQTPINQHFTSARCAFSSCDIPETRLSGKTGYQPGGTFMASTGRWATRSMEKPLVDPPFRHGPLVRIMLPWEKRQASRYPYCVSESQRRSVWRFWILRPAICEASCQGSGETQHSTAVHQ